MENKLPDPMPLEQMVKVQDKTIAHLVNSLANAHDAMTRMDAVIFGLKEFLRRAKLREDSLMQDLAAQSKIIESFFMGEFDKAGELLAKLNARKTEEAALERMFQLPAKEGL